MRCDDLVRLGNDNDGGYLVNQADLSRTQLLVSMGVGNDWRFEQQFCQQVGCPVQAYDPDVNTDCAERREFFTDPNRLDLLKVSNVSSDTTVTVAEILAGRSNVFLKCDIEGGEYDIFQDLLDTRQAWTGMVMEVHDIDQWDNYNTITNFISKCGLQLVHLHVNNWGYWNIDGNVVPRFLEITLSSAHNMRYDSSLTLPHQLDMPNNAKDTEFAMNF
jgi:hypothetical protein